MDSRYSYCTYICYIILISTVPVTITVPYLIFCVQVRFQLAQWIEENYIPGVKLNPEDVGAQARGTHQPPLNAVIRNLRRM